MSKTNSLLLQLLAAILFTEFVIAAEHLTLVLQKKDAAPSNIKLNVNLTGVQYFSESTADSNFHQQAQMEGTFEKKSGQSRWLAKKRSISV